MFIVPKRTQKIRISISYGKIREMYRFVFIYFFVYFLSRANNEAIMMGGGLALDSILRTFFVRCIGGYTKEGVGT